MIFDRGSLPVLESLLGFAGARHRAVAANIANLDTAGYRTLDVPVAAFEEALGRAFREQRESPTGVFAMKGVELEFSPTSHAGTLKANGNNVDLDLEMAKMVRNQSLYSTAAALLAQQFSVLREAIAGRVTA